MVILLSKRFDLKPFASIGVTYSRHEKGEAESQHGDVQHEMLLCAVTCEGDRERALSLYLSGEVPFHA
jgi:hypothetical protein